MYVFASPLFLFELWSNHITVRIMTLPCVDIVACIFSSLLIPCPTAVHHRLLSYRNSYRDHAMNMQLPCNIHEIPLASCTCWFGVLTAVLTPSSILNLSRQIFVSQGFKRHGSQREACPDIFCPPRASRYPARVLPRGAHQDGGERVVQDGCVQGTSHLFPPHIRNIRALLVHNVCTLNNLR